MSIQHPLLGLLSTGPKYGHQLRVESARPGSDHGGSGRYRARPDGSRQFPTSIGRHLRDGAGRCDIRGFSFPFVKRNRHPAKPLGQCGDHRNRQPCYSRFDRLVPASGPGSARSLHLSASSIGYGTLSVGYRRGGDDSARALTC